MSTLTFIKDEDRVLVQANELFAAMKRKKTDDDMEIRNAFRSWLADRILSLEMEEGFDYVIFLNADSIREMLRYETAPEEVGRFFSNYEQYVTQA
jgi:hypothetical protein